MGVGQDRVGSREAEAKVLREHILRQMALAPPVGSGDGLKIEITNLVYTFTSLEMVKGSLRLLGLACSLAHENQPDPDMPDFGDHDYIVVWEAGNTPEIPEEVSPIRRAMPQ